MSLINKMLQDLDARGGGTAAAHAPELKPAPPAEGHRRPLMLAGAGVALLVLAAAGWYGWQYWKQHGATAAVPVAVDDRSRGTLSLQPPPGATTAVSPPVALPPPGSAQAVSSSVAAPPASPGKGPSDSSSVAVPPGSPGTARTVSSSAAAPPASVPDDAPAKPASAGSKPAREAQADPAAAVASRRDARAASESDAARQPTPAPSPARKSGPSSAPSSATAVNELTPKQVAENTYRRALASLQEGRVSSALADLDKAVEIDPRNDAARQTYISLLLEAKRNDEAIRHLRLALGIDPRQPGLAMVLARLQLEKGGPALKTLLTTLPYAGNSADYHGFLAGVLQREQRHTEAAQHYRDALRLSPGNGVWWMGLGISLQAEQHLPEARDAYTRARASNGLTPELQAFLERKLEQLSR